MLEARRDDASNAWLQATHKTSRLPKASRDQTSLLQEKLSWWRVSSPVTRIRPSRPRSKRKYA